MSLFWENFLLQLNLEEYSLKILQPVSQKHNPEISKKTLKLTNLLKSTYLIEISNFFSDKNQSFKLLQHYKSNKLIEDFVGRARVGPVFLQEPTDVTSQVVKSTKQSLSLCIY